jgi:CDP-diglyceride synthetase
MKFFVKDSERRPDPAPVKSNSQIAIFVGMAFFAIALIVILIGYDSITNEHKIWYPYTCMVGLVLGVVALFRTNNR